MTLAARAEMGRWAWSSDALDFDSDGWEDLYVVNGMFTRADGDADVDLDSFFWRQVVARVAARPASRARPTTTAGAPPTACWSADGSQAQHERNVLLRNDGQGGFDEVSGSVGLDLDQDGRSFAVLDYDRDGDPDLALMAAALLAAAPPLPQRLSRGGRAAAGPAPRRARRSNRDAVGARVTVETDRLRRTRIVQAGSGFISQHSKELLFGLGRSQRIVKVTIVWPSGRTQDFCRRARSTTASGSRRAARPCGAEPFRAAPSTPPAAVAARPPRPRAEPSTGAWLYEPFPAPDFTLADLDGQERSLAALARAARGAPLLGDLGAAVPAALEELARQAPRWPPPAPRPGRGRRPARGRGQGPRGRAGLASRSLAASEEWPAPTRSSTATCSTAARTCALPTVFLLDAQGEIVKVYRDRIAASRILEDVPKIDAVSGRSAWRARCPSRAPSTRSPGERNYFQYGLELVRAGLRRAGRCRPSSARPGSTRARSRSTTWARCT